MANPNTNIIVSNRILFEFGAFGKLDVTHQAYPMRAALLNVSLQATDEQPFFMQQVILCSLFLMYVVMVAFHLYKNGLQYFTYMWNLLDLIVVVLVITYVNVRLQLLDAVQADALFLPEMLGIPEFFFPFSKLISPLQLADGVLAFLGLVAWVRLLKYLTLLGTFRLLIRTLERATQDLLVFSALLAVIIFGFSI